MHIVHQEDTVAETSQSLFHLPAIERLTGRGCGAFETIDFGNSGHNCAAHAFDWDGDGHLDLITGHNTGGVYATPTELNYFRGLGDGHFDPPITLATYPGLEAWRMVGPSLF